MLMNFKITLVLATIINIVYSWRVFLPKHNNEIVNEILGDDPRLSKKTDSKYSSLSDSGDKKYFPVIGHRGAGLDAPENSLSAFKQCYDKGCHFVEFDVTLTSDDVPILFHDDNVNRLTSATGSVSKMSWDQLKALDISEKHPMKERFKGERVALLSETMKLCLDNDMRMIIDVKDGSYKMLQVILEYFKKFPQLYKRAMVSSFNPYFIYQVRKHEPKIVSSLAIVHLGFSRTSSSKDDSMLTRLIRLPQRILLSAFLEFSTWLINCGGYRLLGNSAVLLHKDDVTEQVVAKWEKRGIRVMVWTVNDPKEKRNFRENLRIAYITDTLDNDGPQ